MSMLRSRRCVIMLSVLVLAGSIMLAVSHATAQESGPTRFDPFNPAASLDMPHSGSAVAEAPATQPSQEQPIAGVGAPGRPIIRDPYRPPTRSPYRP